MIINVLFVKAGQNYCLQLNDDIMFAEAAFKFFEKVGMNANDNPKFFFNSQEIRIDSYKSLRELGIVNMSTIEVVLENQVNNNLILSMNPSLYDSDYVVPVNSIINPIPIQNSLLNSSVYEEEISQLKEELDVYKNENKKLKDELNVYKNENKKLNEEIKNYILGNKLLNNQIAEANKAIVERDQLKEDIKKKEKEIVYLKNKLNNINRKIVDFNKIIVINFISSDQKINCGIKCLSTDTFAEVEEQLYLKYKEYRETNNNFVAKGKHILRFKKICENGIKDGDIVQLLDL